MQRDIRPTYDQVVYPGYGSSPQDAWTPGLCIQSLGVFRSRGRFAYEQVARHVVPHFVTAGSGAFVADERSFPTGRNELFVFFPGQHIRYSDEARHPWRYTYLRLEGPLAEAVLGEVGITRASPHHVFPEGFSTFLIDLVRGFKNAAPRLFTVRSAWEMVERLGVRPGTEGRDSRDLVEACKLALEHHYTEFPSVEQLARELDVSRSTLFRVFMRREGVSPKVYFDRLRLERAAALLQRSSMRIKEVAHASGFNDASYFCRRFKERFGVSPLRFHGMKESDPG